MDKQQGGREAGMEAGNFVSNPSEKCLKVVLREDDHMFEGRFFQENLSMIHLSQRELPQILPCEILMSKTQDPRHLFLEWQHV